MVSFRTRKKDNQAFPVNQPTSPRADTKPSIIGRLRAKERELREKFRKRREEKGKQRIKDEMVALKRERITAERLRQELEVEQAREAVAKKGRDTQAEFSRIEKERFSRTKRGQFVALAKKGAIVGLAKARESLAQQRKVARRTAKRKAKGNGRKRRKPQKEIGAFGIEF